MEVLGVRRPHDVYFSFRTSGVLHERADSEAKDLREYALRVQPAMADVRGRQMIIMALFGGMRAAGCNQEAGLQNRMG
jgi:hypothetical protein